MIKSVDIILNDDEDVEFYQIPMAETFLMGVDGLYKKIAAVNAIFGGNTYNAIDLRTFNLAHFNETDLVCPVHVSVTLNVEKRCVEDEI